MGLTECEHSNVVIDNEEAQYQRGKCQDCGRVVYRAAK